MNTGGWVQDVLRAAVAPGFFSNGPVQTALVVGGGAAVVSAVVGVFTVIRGQSFAGHALADVSSAGGALAFLIGVSPLTGFVAMALAGGAGMEAAGFRRARGRDLATGAVLGAGLGLTALLLYLDATRTTRTGAAIAVMFGSMFAIPRTTAALAAAVGAAALLLVAAVYRPLLLSSLSADLAEARGVRVAAVGLLYTLALGLAVSLAALTVGAILSTALLVGPAAAALRVTRRTEAALVLASAIGLCATWLGVLLAYDSYGWTPGHGWPVSFFVVTLIMAAYVALSLGHGRPAAGAAASPAGGA